MTQEPRGWSAGDEDASFSEAGQALPEDGEEDVGGPLEAAVAVVDPVLGAGLQETHDALGDEAGGRLVGPGAGDPLDAGPAGTLDGWVLEDAGGGHEVPRGLVVAGEQQVAADDAAQAHLVG